MDENILGKNIQFMRKFHGETLEELGNVLNVTKSTISGYESGRRIPEAGIIESIARYYGKTVDEMINSKLYELDLFDTSKIVDLDETFDVFLHMFPLIETEKAYENKSYAKGMGYIKEIIHSMKKGEELSGTIIMVIMDCFIEAIESGVIEAAANILWCIFFLWTQQYSNIDNIRRLNNRMFNNQLDYKELRYEYRKDAKKISNMKKDFIKDFDKMMFELISVLKDSGRWSQIGDYYLALRYFMGIVDTNISEEMNRTIGMQMMTAFACVGNKYALDCLQSVDNV